MNVIVFIVIFVIFIGLLQFYNYILFEVIMEFVNIIWKMEFLSKLSQDYINLEFDIIDVVEEVFYVKNVSFNVEVIEFKFGSVLVFLKISIKEFEI